MSTTITENIPELLTNFDISNGHTSGNLNWKIDFNERGAALSNKGFIESPMVYGQQILVDNVLSFQPSTTQLTVGNKSIYTNPGSTTMQLLDDVSGISSFEVDINKFTRSTNYYFRSYDLFEKISSDLLDDEYAFEEDFFGYSNGTIEIGIVLLKAPHQSKIRNPTGYVNTILSKGAVGGIIGNSIDQTCSSSLLSEDERIITLVYKKNGKYYDENNVEILPFDGDDDSISFNYFGSRDISALNLSNVGFDGRYLDNFSYNKQAITYNKFINDNRTMNTVFYPKKEHNTVENVYSVSTVNPFKIISSVTIINNIQIVSFTVTVNGNTYTTNPIAVNYGSTKLSPTIRSRDFSNSPSFNISTIIATFSTGNIIDVNYGAYLTKNLAPIIQTTVNNVPVLNSTTISTYPLVLSFVDINSDLSSVQYTITKNDLAYATGTYSTPININTPGTYKITTYSVNSGNPTKNSENATATIVVYKQAAVPTINFDTLTLDGVLDSYTTIWFSSPDNIDIYFTTNGEIPDPSIGNCYIAHPSATFKIYDACTLKFFAYNGEYLKSDLVTYPLAIVKSNTLVAPTITTSNASTSADKLQLTITAAVGDIYYTIDGTTPSKDSIKYEAGHFIFPNAGNSSLIVKAIAISHGYNSSTVTTKTFDFNFTCAPWDVVGDVVIGNNVLFMGDGAVITRNTLMNPNYSLSFDVIGSLGLGVLEIGYDSLIGDKNNYSGQYSPSISPIISTVYSGAEYSIYSLGFRRNKYETNNYKKYGEIVVSKQDSLKVTYQLKYVPGFTSVTIKSDTNQTVSLPGTFYYKIKVANLFTSIESPWTLIPLTSNDYQRIACNSLYGGEVSNFTLGDFTFSCV